MARDRKQKFPAAPPPRRLARGFVQTGGLLGQDIRKAGEKRGFAETRLLTQWAEVAGPAVAAIARPVKVSYRQQGLGATLTLLTSGAQAPMLQMQIPAIIERVNACYGYNAISKIQITQTAASGLAPQGGFAEDQAGFEPEPVDRARPLSPERQQTIDHSVADVADEGLRKALSALGAHVMAKPENRQR